MSEVRTFRVTPGPTIHVLTPRQRCDLDLALDGSAPVRERIAAIDRVIDAMYGTPRARILWCLGALAWLASIAWAVLS